MDTDTLKGNLNEFKGAIQKKWGKITDQDLEVIKGEKDKLIGIIQKKYGEGKESIEEALKSIMGNSENALEDTLAALKEKKDEAVDYTQQLTSVLQEKIKKNPLPSMFISLGVGFLIGKLIK
ncbi:MAG: CsbD family protein [Candidatus Paracaedibacteraceae bacterium]|nr:CsbD family protein [Candidatus Paracaedibacteraceae bacterium]